MDYCASIKATPTIEGALPSVVKTQRRGGAVAFAGLQFSSLSTTKSISQSQNLVFCTRPTRQTYSRRVSQPAVVAVANADSTKCGGVGTPLVPSSPEGMFLSRILQNQRHLFHFAVAEQLDELASIRKAADARRNRSSDSVEFLLHKRIAEMRENECQRAVEDVIYMSIVHKFSEFEVPMVPKLSKCITGDRLQIWPSKSWELESIHTPEVQEMVKEHLATILRTREKSSAEDGLATTKIDRLHLGRIYAASIMYGYFLKSAFFRRQLNLNLARTCDDPSQKDDQQQPFHHRTSLSLAELYRSKLKNLVALDQSTDAQMTSLCQDSRHESLRSYVMGFDSEALQRCAKLKSKEAVNVIENHTWALVGDEFDSNDDVVITVPSLERLVLEAVAFGSFLWDVERAVDSVYGLTEN